ncbi:helix-turn-helix domain-containing protein [Dactylosporangium matsuzakiense]|uniref:HTH cro/C1-type domain-containing protein n=1 Tax=Dactylosporangium matsuzakiense TaxID=53360 RepID=A0A9W6KXP3_9ACTN|nr:helix-turn-helix domain-containing protein [Dactylosporangium matsuzakiense]UWZ41408.1 helix-turn-helix domain-containing protein [Dactylosporangium matsuzakiense]GLL08614.1 hypothetical protein GCM10017581_103810 [Dactylosporangium matsuzakiense]
MDSDGATTPAVAQFLTDLRALRAAAGAPSYSTLARESGLPRSTLHDALRGHRLPSREVTIGLVRACGADPAEWQDRWTALRAALDTPPPSDQAVRPVSDGTGRPFWRRRPRTVAAAAALLLAAGLVGGWSAWHRGDCAGERVYRVDEAGAVLDADGHPIGRVDAGDTVRVKSLVHDRFPHRYFGTVDASGTTGYLDEAKLTYQRTGC